MLKRPVVACLPLLFLLFSCDRDLTPDETGSENFRTPDILIRDGFSLDAFDREGREIVGNLLVEWDSFERFELGDVLWYEFPARQEVVVTLELDMVKGTDHSVLASIHPGTGEIAHYVLQFAHYEPSQAVRPLYGDLEGFQGMVYLYDLQGRTRMLHYVEAGETVMTVVDEDIPPADMPMDNARCVRSANTSRAACNSTWDCGLTVNPGCGGGGGGSYTNVTTHHYTDWYNDRGNGTWEYSWTQYNGATHQWVWVPSGGTASSDGAAYSYYNYGQETWHYSDSPLGEAPEEREVAQLDVVDGMVIVNRLEGKEECVYDKLIDLALFKSTIEKFEESEDMNLHIMYGNCSGSYGSSADACTDGGLVANGLVFIKIQNRGMHPLEIAATLLHEGIHAEMYKYVNEHETGVDPNDRERLLYLYFYYGAQNGKDVETTWAQHRYMAEKFVEPIAEAIRQLDNYRYSLGHYMAFGWDGLEDFGVDAFNHNDPYTSLSPEEKADYQAKRVEVLNVTTFGDDCPD